MVVAHPFTEELEKAKEHWMKMIGLDQMLSSGTHFCLRESKG